MQPKSVHLTTASSLAPIVQDGAEKASPKHTPTPWVIRDDPPQFETIIYSGEYFVCRVYAGEDRDTNASLIVDAVNNIASNRQELIAAYERIARLEADLHECLEYFTDHYDVNDGDYGVPSPNREMQLGCMIQETLHGPGAF